MKRLPAHMVGRSENGTCPTFTICPKSFMICYDFNEDIDSWNVYNAATMNRMFFAARKFSQVNDMHFMFGGAYSFDGDVSRWNVSSVTSMDSFVAHPPLRETCLVGMYPVSQIWITCFVMRSSLMETT